MFTSVMLLTVCLCDTPTPMGRIDPGKVSEWIRIHKVSVTRGDTDTWVSGWITNLKKRRLQVDWAVHLYQRQGSNRKGRWVLVAKKRLMAYLKSGESDDWIVALPAVPRNIRIRYRFFVHSLESW